MRPSGVFFLVLLLALLIRGGVLLLTPGALEADPDGYRRLAENLVERGTFGAGDAPTAFRPPLYPLLLAGGVAWGDYSRVAIGLLHVVLGVATVGLVLVLGRWWGLGNRAAALAAILVACDPILLAQSTQVMTETPAAFLATAGLVALTRLGRQLNCRPWAAMLAGATLALGALCRPTLLLWAIAAGALLVYGSAVNYCRRRLQTPIDMPRNESATEDESATGVASYSRLVSFAAFVLGALIVLSPWAIRNQLQFGRPIVTTTHGGYTLLLANNPEFYQWLRSGQWGSVWRADEFNAAWDQRKPPDELQADRLARTEAWQNIRREPGTFAYACLVRIGRFWSPLPHQVTADETPLCRLSRWAVATWYLVEFLLAALGLAWCLPRDEGRGTRGEGEVESGEWRVESASLSAFRLPPSAVAWLYGLLLVVCLTAVHAVFWTDMRMRAPLMPVVALAAAAAFWRSIGGRRGGPSGRSGTKR